MLFRHLNSRVLILVVLPVAWALASGVLLAQRAMITPTKLEYADADSDGEVTAEELKTFLTQRYIEAWSKKIDTNRNGKISKWEFRLARKAMDKVFEDEAEAVADFNKSAESAKPMSTVDMMNDNFAVMDPRLGANVKDLIALDESGNEVNFESFRGKHVVVVFGCLT